MTDGKGILRHGPVADYLHGKPVLVVEGDGCQVFLSKGLANMPPAACDLLRADELLILRCVAERERPEDQS